ncbi:MAG: hypothetical protein IJC39_02210 [Firmicutes bacterium]|nr:hypothetical protein [Bacillota bacterium]
MKKKLFKIIAAALCISMLGAGAAFADEAAETTPKNAEAAAETADETPALDEELVEHTHYLTEKGTIQSIEPNEEGWSMLVDDGNGGVIYNFVNAFIIDAASSTYKLPEDLEVGMEIVALMPSDGQMTMSLPPITPSAEGFFIPGENSLLVSKFDENLLSEDGSLVLNIGEETMILSKTGTKSILSAQDIPGKEVLVVYSIVMTSEPGQTTPSLVMLLEPVADAGDVIEHGEVPLRTTLEERGYKVTWTSHSEPVLIEKDDISIAVKLGEKELVINGERTEMMAHEVTLDGDTMYICESILIWAE